MRLRSILRRTRRIVAAVAVVRIISAGRIPTSLRLGITVW